MSDDCNSCPGFAVFVRANPRTLLRMDSTHTPDELRRRVKAARAYAGYKSAGELAAALDFKGLGERNLRELEGPSAPRPFRAVELREIARVCGLPYEFFTADLSLLGVLADEWPQSLQAELGLPSADIVRDALRLYRDRRLAAGEPAQPSFAARLEQVEQALRELKRDIAGGAVGDATESVLGSLEDLSGGGAPTPEAAPGSGGAADAIAAPRRVPGAAIRRTGQSSGL
jgi:hypothetical protein